MKEDVKMTIIQQQWEIVKNAMKAEEGGSFAEKENDLYEDIYLEQDGEVYCWRLDKVVNEISLFKVEGSI